MNSKGIRQLRCCGLAGRLLEWVAECPLLENIYHSRIVQSLPIIKNKIQKLALNFTFSYLIWHLINAVHQIIKSGIEENTIKRRQGEMYGRICHHTMRKNKIPGSKTRI